MVVVVVGGRVIFTWVYRPYLWGGGITVCPTGPAERHFNEYATPHSLPTPKMITLSNVGEIGLIRYYSL
jgi:hypothetical protein